MLSRRSIRVKVMQVLFAENRDEVLQLSDTKKLFWGSIEQTFNMFLLNLYTLIEIAKVSQGDENTRKSKYLPTEEDKKFKAKLFSNGIISFLYSNEKLKNRFETLDFGNTVDKDLIQKIYTDFTKEEAYIKYWNEDTDEKNDIEILLELYRFCRANEFFNEVMEDHFFIWPSEKSIVIGVVKKVIKLKDPEESFYMSYYPEKTTTKEFGENLLTMTHEMDGSLNDLIVPNLKNWDKDRVTILDMILIKMAISEFLNFKTIPPKVTLNEYVELSKSYSTEKSKEFVNGVLDKILKELEEQGKIVKELS